MIVAPDWEFHYFGGLRDLQNLSRLPRFKSVEVQARFICELKPAIRPQRFSRVSTAGGIRKLTMLEGNN